VFITPIKVVRENAVSGIIVNQIRIEKQQRYRVTGYAAKEIPPGAHAYISSFDSYRHTLRQGLKTIFWGPFGRALKLIASRIKPLVEITFAVKQCNRNHRQPKICR
jgi:hypothetical protein